jgi:hypothetical protein
MQHGFAKLSADAFAAILQRMTSLTRTSVMADDIDRKCSAASPYSSERL